MVAFRLTGVLEAREIDCEMAARADAWMASTFLNGESDILDAKFSRRRAKGT
jgi:hypothetical protein